MGGVRNGKGKGVGSLAISSQKGMKKHRGAARKRRRTRAIVAELVEEAKLYEASEDLYKDTTSVIDAMQLMLNRGMALYRLAAKQADKLTLDEMWSESIDDMGNTIVMPSRWVQFEAAMRSEVFEMAVRMEGQNIDERFARVEEAKVELLGRALQAAAKSIGLDDDQQRSLGAALRAELNPAPTDSTDHTTVAQAANPNPADDEPLPQVKDTSVVDDEAA